MNSSTCGISSVVVGNLSGPSRNPLTASLSQPSGRSSAAATRTAAEYTLGHEHRVDVLGRPALVVDQRDGRSADHIEIGDQTAFGQFGSQGGKGCEDIVPAHRYTRLSMPAPSRMPRRRNAAGDSTMARAHRSG